MAWNAQCPPVVEIEPEIRVRAVRLNMVGVEAAADHAARLACVVVALEHALPPFPFFCAPMFRAIPKIRCSWLAPAFRGELWRLDPSPC